MTNHWTDLKNSDVILVIGANPAENHPISFKWILRAKEAGGTLISVDPRFTRTSSKADIYAPLRSGSDIGFFGGLINYILSNELCSKEYVANYTNASFLLTDAYKFEDGIFSGFDAGKKAYDKASWAFAKDENGLVKKDPTLADPHTVYQVMKKHYERYTLDNVSKITGCPKEKLEQVYKTFGATGAPDKSGTMLYAMGQTQHTVGVQNIRAMTIVQMLLGNIGVAGGGINALRGESNVQGSTDHGLLYDVLPGYMPTPRGSLVDLKAYNDATTPKTKEPKSINWWSNRPKYMASYLKALYPAQKPEESYKWLPKCEDGKNYSWLALFDAMCQGAFKGFFAWGQNPANSTANAGKVRKALGTLDWLVTVNPFETETAAFWKGPGMEPKKIKTEVFVLPCAVSIEKEGSITNSGRLSQWRYAAVKPLGGVKPDGDLMYELFEKIKALYKADAKAVCPEPIMNLNWDIATGKAFDAKKVARLINGYFVADKTIGDKAYKAGDPVPGFALLQDDGSTASGNWLFCGSFTDKNMAARRDKNQTPMQEKIALFPNWAWAWPVNRRILYNRASVDPQGKPYQPQKPVIEWATDKWAGDVPDGPWPPLANEGGKLPFIMNADGVGQIFGPGRNDGPLPEYYEPLECPVTEQPFSKTLHNPTALTFAGPMDHTASCDPRFPFVCTTYRVTEHWQTGVMSRHIPWLLEAQPQMFVELSPELAKLRGINHGDKCIVESARGSIWAIAVVTARLRPMDVMGQTVHMIGLPWHFGWLYPKDGGDSANLLTPSVGDPNTGIPETKAFMANVKKA